MELKRGAVVISLKGRDKGRAMAVVEYGKKRVTVSDGRERPLDNPKSKNPKHLRTTAYELDFEKIKSDKALRKALRGTECK